MSSPSSLTTSKTGLTSYAVRSLLSPAVPESALSALLSGGDPELQRLLRHSMGAHMSSAVGVKLLKLAASEYAYRRDAKCDTYRLTAVVAKLQQVQQWEAFLSGSGAVNVDEWFALSHRLSIILGRAEFCAKVLLPRYLTLDLDATLLDVPEIFSRLLPGVAPSKLSASQKIVELRKALEERGVSIASSVTPGESGGIVMTVTVSQPSGEKTSESAVAVDEETSTLLSEVIMREARRLAMVRSRRLALANTEDAAAQSSSGGTLFAVPSLAPAAGSSAQARKRRSWALLTSAEKRLVTSWINKRLKALLRLKDPYRATLDNDGLIPDVIDSEGWIPLEDISRILRDDFDSCNSLTTIEFPNMELLKDVVEGHDHFQRFQLGMCQLPGSAFEGKLSLRALTAHDNVSQNDSNTNAESLTLKILSGFERLDLAHPKAALSASPAELLEAHQLPRTVWLCIDKKTVGDLPTHGMRVFDNVGFVGAFAFSALERFASYMKSPVEERYDEKLCKANVKFMELRMDAILTDTTANETAGEAPTINFRIYRLPAKSDDDVGHFAIVPVGKYARVLTDAASVTHVTRFIPLQFCTGRVCTVNDGSTDVESIQVARVAIPTKDPNVRGALMDHVRQVLTRCDECRRSESDAAEALLPSASLEEAVVDAPVLEKPKGVVATKLDAAPLIAEVNQFAASSTHALTLRIPKIDAAGKPFQGRTLVVSDIKQHVLALGFRYRVASGPKLLTHDELIVTKQRPFDHGTFKAAIESFFGGTFTDDTLLRDALTPEHLNSTGNYERLEFLGDAVLDYIIVHDTARVREWERSGRLQPRGYLRAAEALTDAGAVLATQNAAHDICRNSVLAWLLPVEFFVHTVVDYDGFVEKKCADHFEALVGAMYEDGWSFDQIRRVLARALRSRLSLLHDLVHKEGLVSATGSSAPPDACDTAESDALPPPSEGAAAAPKVAIGVVLAEATALLQTDPEAGEREILTILLRRFATPSRVEAIVTAFQTFPYADVDAVRFLDTDASFNCPRLLTAAVMAAQQQKQANANSANADMPGQGGSKSNPKNRHYPVALGYGPLAGNMAINSHAACVGFPRIQDKIFATHFTTGMQYSYRMIRRPEDMLKRESEMLHRQLEAVGLKASEEQLEAMSAEAREVYWNRYINFTRAVSLSPEVRPDHKPPIDEWTLAARVPDGTPFVNEILTEVTRLVFDIDGVRLTFCRLHALIAEWAEFRFPWMADTGRGYVFDCSGMSIVKCKMKHSYHIHFPDIYVTVRELELETRSLVEFIMQRVLLQVGAVSSAVRRGLMVLCVKPNSPAGTQQCRIMQSIVPDDVDCVGRVVFSSSQLETECGRLQAELWNATSRRKPHSLLEVLDPTSDAIFDTILSLMPLASAFVALRAVSRRTRLNVYRAVMRLNSGDVALVRCLAAPTFRSFHLWSEESSFRLVRARDCVRLDSPSNMAPIVELVRQLGGKSKSTLSARCQEYYNSVMLSLLEADVYGPAFWMKVIDCGVATSRKLRHYGSDKFDQKYGLEARLVRFAGFLSLPHGGLYDNAERLEVVLVDDLLELSSLRSPECVSPKGEVFYAWNLGRRERLDAAAYWLNRQESPHFDATFSLIDALSADDAISMSPEVLMGVMAMSSRTFSPYYSLDEAQHTALGEMRRPFPSWEQLVPTIPAAPWDMLIQNLFVIRPASSGGDKVDGVIRYGALMPSELWFDAERHVAVFEPTGDVYPGKDLRDALVSTTLGGGGGMEDIIRRLLPHLLPPSPFQRSDVPSYVFDRWILSVEGVKAHAAAITTWPVPRGYKGPSAPSSVPAKAMPAAPAAKPSAAVAKATPQSKEESAPAAVASALVVVVDLQSALKHLKWKSVPSNANKLQLKWAFVTYMNRTAWTAAGAQVDSASEFGSLTPVPIPILPYIKESALGLMIPPGTTHWLCREPTTLAALRAMGLESSFLFSEYHRVTIPPRESSVVVLLELPKVDPITVVKALQALRDGGILLVACQYQAQALGRIFGLGIL